MEINKNRILKIKISRKKRTRNFVNAKIYPIHKQITSNWYWYSYREKLISTILIAQVYITFSLESKM